MTDPLHDKTGDDPKLTELEGLLGSYAHRAALRALPARRTWRTAALLVKNSSRPRALSAK